LALEEAPKTGERANLFNTARYQTLGRYSDALEFYAMDRERRAATAPTVEEVIQRLGGRALMMKLRAEPDPAQRYPAAVARMRAGRCFWKRWGSLHHPKASLRSLDLHRHHYRSPLQPEHRRVCVDDWEVVGERLHVQPGLGRNTQAQRVPRFARIVRVPAAEAAVEDHRPRL